MKKIFMLITSLVLIMVLVSCGTSQHPTFVGMRSGTLDDYDQATELYVQEEVKLLSDSADIYNYPIVQLSGIEEVEVVDGFNVVKYMDELVLLFDIRQPEDESYIYRNFAVQLYSNFNIIGDETNEAGELMEEGTYDYEWFSGEYEGVGNLFLLKGEEENLDTLVIKIPILARYLNDITIGVEKITFDGVGGEEVDYDENSINEMEYTISLEPINSLVLSEYILEDSNVILAIAQYLPDEDDRIDYITIFDDISYNIYLNDELISEDFILSNFETYRYNNKLVVDISIHETINNGIRTSIENEEITETVTLKIVYEYLRVNGISYEKEISASVLIVL